jgi:oligopeptide transport system ATP-binding protein
MTTLLDVRDLRKSYSIRGAKGHERLLLAVDGVSFSVASGTSLAIVGESGSGKSTTARIVAGLETATSGAVSMNGVERKPTGLSAKERLASARQVQMVFQDPNSSLNPRQHVGDAIGEVLDVHFELSKADRTDRIALLLQQVGLEVGQGESYPRHLSGGQRQRVAIARALALEPRLLILDEAVAALDVSVQAQVINLLDDLREQTGVTYLFVSHDLAVVRQVTDETIVLRGGRVVEQGATEAVLNTPQHEYTKALLAAIPTVGWRPRRRSVRELT